ncbi:MAG: NAD(P)-binding domain-containing protein, partial [Pseudonocardiaceae bacterium]
YLQSRETIVKIGIIGAGRIGGNAARMLTRVGHEVLVSFSRDPTLSPHSPPSLVTEPRWALPLRLPRSDRSS